MNGVGNFARALGLAACLVVCCGCTKQSGPRRYALSGTVTLADGSPAPAGEISFEPDSASGNRGPGSTTQIKDGKYSVPQDQGVSGGKYVVVISPFDGIPLAESPQGKALRRIPYSEKVELPAQDSTYDFKIGK